MTRCEREKRRNTNLPGLERRCDGSKGPSRRISNSLPGGHSEREPPDPIPNSEVKTLCADGSVPFRHARVGHCQALNGRPRWETSGAFSFVGAPDHGGCAGCGALASAAKPTGTFYLRRRSALPARAIG